LKTQKPIFFSPPEILPEDINAVVQILQSGWITTGPRVIEFEKELTHTTGAQFVVCLSSASAALKIILRVLGIGPGDEVITSPFTFTSTASAIHHVGATIQFADIDPNSFHIDPIHVEKKIQRQKLSWLLIMEASLVPMTRFIRY